MKFQAKCLSLYYEKKERSMYDLDAGHVLQQRNKNNKRGNISPIPIISFSLLCDCTHKRLKNEGKGGEGNEKTQSLFVLCNRHSIPMFVYLPTTLTTLCVIFRAYFSLTTSMSGKKTSFFFHVCDMIDASAILFHLGDSLTQQEF